MGKVALTLERLGDRFELSLRGGDFRVEFRDRRFSLQLLLF